MKRLLWNCLLTLVMPGLLIAALLPCRRRTWLIWGSVPLINNKYWSAAMREAGYDTKTMMQGYYGISHREDFDVYFADLAPARLPHLMRIGIGTIRALFQVLRQARVVHIPFEGFALNASMYWKLESTLLRLANVKTVVIPYGADANQYSRLTDTSLKAGLLASYPLLARKERAISQRVEHWSARADAVITGLMFEGLGRWDLTVPSAFCIDLKQWEPKRHYSDHDGRNGVVRILHTPNHRGFKGTEYLIEAVDKLRGEGLQVELLLLEKVLNSQVRETLPTVDVLAEQFVATGYALSGIEGMGSGVPVLANLEQEAYSRLFRRFSFLDECPILSTTPETLTENLRTLIGNPGLREELGRAGRAYVQKYHSYATAQYMFGAVYDRIVDRKDVDLINLFHPLKAEFNRRSAQIEHPLVENRLPPNWDSQFQC